MRTSETEPHSSLVEKGLWWVSVGGVIAGVLYNINYLVVSAVAIATKNVVYERPRHQAQAG